MTTPQQALSDAVQRDHSDDEEIARQHQARVDTRMFYRVDRIVNLASLALCDSHEHNRTVRACDGCRTAIREILPRRQVEVADITDLEPSLVDGEVFIP